MPFHRGGQGLQGEAIDNHQRSVVNADDDPLARQVRADLIERAEAGLRKYGAYLTTHNGRDALWDWYQELLDGVMYARQANLERDDRDPVLWELYQESVRQACALRDYIQILPR